jgi:hypothetical protein
MILAAHWIERPEVLTWIVVGVSLVGLALSAWVLNLSCRLCRVEPPGFLKSLMIILVIGMISGMVSVFIDSFSEPVPGWIGALYSCAVAIGVLCATLPTDPITAFLITVVQAVVWIGLGLVITCVGIIFITMLV